MLQFRETKHCQRQNKPPMLWIRNWRFYLFNNLDGRSSEVPWWLLNVILFRLKLRVASISVRLSPILKLEKCKFPREASRQEQNNTSHLFPFHYGFARVCLNNPWKDYLIYTCFTSLVNCRCVLEEVEVETVEKKPILQCTHQYVQ